MATSSPSLWAQLALADSNAQQVNIQGLAEAAFVTNRSIAEANTDYRLHSNAITSLRKNFGVSFDANRQTLVASVLATRLSTDPWEGTELPENVELPEVDLGEVSLVSDDYRSYQPGAVSDDWFQSYFYQNGQFDWSGGYWDSYLDQIFTESSGGYGGLGFGGGLIISGSDPIVSGPSIVYPGLFHYNPGWVILDGWSPNSVPAPTMETSDVDIDPNELIDQYNQSIDDLQQQIVDATSTLQISEDVRKIVSWSDNNPVITVPGVTDDIEFHTTETLQANEIQGTSLANALGNEFSVSTEIDDADEDRAFARQTLAGIDKLGVHFNHTLQNTADGQGALLASLDYTVGLLGGLIQGFFVDGAWGTYEFAKELAIWGAEKAILSDPRVKIADNVYHFFKGEPTYRQVRNQKTAAQIHDAFLAASAGAPYVLDVKYDFDRLDKILKAHSSLGTVGSTILESLLKTASPLGASVATTGIASLDIDRSQAEDVLAEWYADLRPRTKTLLIALEPVLEEVIDELKTLDLKDHAEQIGTIYGRIMGMILFETALTVATTGASITATLGKARLITAKIREFKHLEKFDLGKKVVNKLDDAILYLAKVTSSRICFVAGTKVHTQDGLKNIEEIKVGDTVLTRGDDQSHNEPTTHSRVVETFMTTPNRLYHLTYRTESGATETLLTTGNHPFYEIGAGDFVAAKDLAVGATFSLANGSTATLERIETEDAAEGELFTTYNFEVEGTHTYFVGECGAWVHNSGEGLCHLVALEILLEMQKRGDEIQVDEIARIIQRRVGELEVGNNPNVLQIHYDNVIEFLAEGLENSDGELLPPLAASKVEVLKHVYFPRELTIHGVPRTGWTPTYPKHKSAKFGPTNLVTEEMVPGLVDELDEINSQIDRIVQFHNRFGKPPAGIKQGSRSGGPRGVYDNAIESGKQRLPEMPTGYYRESDLFPRKILKKGEVNPGDQRVFSRDDMRLVLGQKGEVYVSFDHYTTFFRIR